MLQMCYLLNQKWALQENIKPDINQQSLEDLEYLEVLTAIIRFRNAEGTYSKFSYHPETLTSSFCVYYRYLS